MRPLSDVGEPAVGLYLHGAHLVRSRRIRHFMPTTGIPAPQDPQKTADRRHPGGDHRRPHQYLSQPHAPLNSDDLLLRVANSGQLVHTHRDAHDRLSENPLYGSNAGFAHGCVSVVVLARPVSGRYLLHRRGRRGGPAVDADIVAAAVETLAEVTSAAATDWARGMQARCRVLVSEARSSRSGSGSPSSGLAATGRARTWRSTSAPWRMVTPGAPAQSACRASPCPRRV